MTRKEKRKAAKPEGWYSKAARDARRVVWLAGAPERERRKFVRVQALRIAAKRKKELQRMIAGLASAAGASVDRIARTAKRRDEEAKAVAKNKRKPPKRVETSKVEGAYGHGADRVERVVDPVASMAARRQLSPRELGAAQRYRKAFDAIRASVKGTLDPDRLGGTEASGRTPSAHLLEAAQDLKQVSDILGVVLRVVVEEIVGLGRTIEETADTMCGEGRRKATQRDRDFIGRSLREALKALADRWYPSRSRVVAYRAPGSKPIDTASDREHFRSIDRPKG